MSNGQLASTGLGTFAIGGVVFQSWWVVGAGLILVASGLLILRFTRHRR